MSKSEMKVRREALVAQLQSMPEEMQVRQQWLVWKYIKKAGGAKPAKVPFYASGQLRGWPNGKPKDGGPTEAQPQVEQGHQLDRGALVAFDRALAVIGANLSFDGIGFAFLPGDGLLGVDIDHAIDAATGEVSDLCRLVIGLCPSYTELSVSGTGVHIILKGDTDKFKDDSIGLEVYCRSQYFTCTGAKWDGQPDQVGCVAPFALTTMRALVEDSKAKQQAAKDEERALAVVLPVAGPVAHVPEPRQMVPSGGNYPPGQDFKRVNDAAMLHLGAWVPEMFPLARPHSTEKHGAGYRITSKDLGRDLQEDLTFTPGGIRDWGTDRGLSPISVGVEFRGWAPKDSMLWLAKRVGVSIEPRRPKLAAVPSGERPEPPDDGEAAGSASQEKTPVPPNEGEGAASATVVKLTPKAKRKTNQSGEGGDGGDMSALTRSNLGILFDGFVYQYGTEVAWDLARRKPIRIAFLRNTFGSEAVRIWMNSERRRVVHEEQIVFEPGVDLGDDVINLFVGLPVEPVEGDCDVMIELLRHLCSTSEAPGMGPHDIADWVLRWCALPLQQLGAKLDSALVFHGPQGTGKNLFFDVLRDLHGEYGVMVGQTEIESTYNTWLSRRTLVIGDEVVSRQEMYHVKNRLKWIVTQKSKIPIRGMYLDTRWESNHANLVFLSNESQPLALEENDRRFLIVYTPTAEDGDLYARVRTFLDAGGAAKFLHFLVNLDLGDFPAHSKPPVTDAKTALIELGYKPAERFMHEWLQGYLALPMRVCSVEQLYRAFRRWSDASGERFPPKQFEFTTQASRFVLERVQRDAQGVLLAPLMKVKVVQLQMDLGTARKAVRMWMPRDCGPGEEFKTEGAWAASSVNEFERALGGFMRRERLDDGEGEP